MKIIIPAIVGVIAISIVLAVLFPGSNTYAKYGVVGSRKTRTCCLNS